MVTVGVCTGPLPPAKPCNECTPLRKELQELLKRLAVAEAKPEGAIYWHTDGQSGDYGGLESAKQHRVIALVQTQTGAESQTNSSVTSEVGVVVEPSVADSTMQTDEQITPKTSFGVNTDKAEEQPVAEKADQSTSTDEFSAKVEATDQETMTIANEPVTETEVVNQETMTAVDELSPRSDRETMTVPKILSKHTQSDDSHGGGPRSERS
ncbi:hypothetical protein COOONC_13638, partial [Cooperia oncophora]